MRSVCSSSRVVITALAVGIMAIAAQPALAEVTDVTIIAPTEVLPVFANPGDDIEVEFEWSHDNFPPPFPEPLQGFQATITIGPVNDPIAEATFEYSILLSPPPHFEIETVNIPAGTLEGCYSVTVEVQERHTDGLCCGQSDIVSAAVCIVESPTGTPTEVPVDIKPSSCPNPINLGKGGVIPVAIAGTVDLDVWDIDPDSIRLMGVEPIRWNYEDVATPYFPNVNDPDCMDCTEEGGDGCLDLTLKFDAQELVEAIRWCYGDGNGELVDRECLILFLTGELWDGTAIAGEDVVRIQGGGGAKSGKSESKKDTPGKGKGKGKPDKDKSDKGKSDKDKPGKDKSDKDKSDKGKPEKDKSKKGKSGKGKSGKGKPDKGKPEKDKSKKGKSGKGKSKKGK